MRYPVGLPNISGCSTWRNQKSFLSVLGLARIARQLAQLSWIRTAKQSPLGKIPLVADTGLRPRPEVGICFSLSSGRVPSMVLHGFWEPDTVLLMNMASPFHKDF